MTDLMLPAEDDLDPNDPNDIRNYDRSEPVIGPGQSGETPTRMPGEPASSNAGPPILPQAAIPAIMPMPKAAQPTVMPTLPMLDEMGRVRNALIFADTPPSTDSERFPVQPAQATAASSTHNPTMTDEPIPGWTHERMAELHERHMRLLEQQEPQTPGTSSSVRARSYDPMENEEQLERERIAREEEQGEEPATAEDSMDTAALMQRPLGNPFGHSILRRLQDARVDMTVPTEGMIVWLVHRCGRRIERATEEDQTLFPRIFFNNVNIT